MYIKTISMNIRNSLILLMFYKHIKNVHKAHVLWPPSGSPANPFVRPAGFPSC